MKAQIDYKLIQDNENALDVNYKGIFHIDNENKKYKITYTENKVLNTLEIDEKEKTAKITNINEMLFKENKDQNIKYKSAYGVIPLRLKTNLVEINHNEDKKELLIHLKYYLYQGSDPIINELNVLVKY